MLWIQYRGRERCLYSSGSHAFKDCTKAQIKCANCGSATHLSNYGGCPSLKKAKVIEHIAHSQAIPYHEAKKQYYNSASPNSTSQN